MANKPKNCPTKIVKLPKASLCCNEDDVLNKQLQAMFGLPDEQHCTDDFYYLGFNCDKGFANQSLTQLVTTLVNEGITVNISNILVQAGPNVNEAGGYGIKVTQTGTVFIVQLNTAGLAGGESIIADNGLTKSGSTIQLGGGLLQDVLINGGTLYNIVFADVKDLFIGSDTLTLKIGGLLGNNGDVLTSDGTNATWQPASAALPPLQNALELVAGNLQWNGDLSLAVTEIRGLGTKDIDFQNIREFWLGTNKLKLRINATTGAPGQVLTALGNGYCEWQNPTVSSGGISFAANGLHTIGNTVYLGGTLIDANTIIQGSGAESFKILNVANLECQTFLYKLSINGTLGNIGDVLTSTGAGATWQPSSSALTASNGLGITAGDIKLGGVLSQDTAIFGGSTFDVFFNAIQTFSIEASLLSITATGNTGNIGQVLTADGAGFCGWADPELIFPIRIDTNNTVTITNTDSTVILDSAISSQTVVLPPAGNGKIYFISQRNSFGAGTQIVPNGTDKIYEGATAFTGGSPYPFPIGGRIILQSKIDGGGNFWMILSKS